MRYLDSGLQYHVYDLGNGRVKKFQTSFLHKLKAINTYHGQSVFRHPLEALRFARGTYRSMKDALAGLHKHYDDIDLSLLGNPVLLDDHVYEQDTVIVFGEALKNSTSASAHELIDRYFDHLITCWQYGFSDSVFNFTINNGVNANGDVILIDLGEITWDKNEVAMLVARKELLQQYSFRSIENKNLRDYIHAECEKRLTKQSLEKAWGALNSAKKEGHGHA
jgi:hypothetical protein